MRLTHLFKALIIPGFLLNISHFEIGMAALQPISEAPLAEEYKAACHFNRNGSTDCTYKVKYTVLKNTGIDDISKLDFQYLEHDSFTVKEARVISPNGKSTRLTWANMDTRMATNPREGFLRNKQTSLAFPNLEVGCQVIYTIHHRLAATPFLDAISDALHFRAKNIRYDYYQVKFTSDNPMVWRSDAMDGFVITASKDNKQLTVEYPGTRYYSVINEIGSSIIRKFPRLLISSSTDPQIIFGQVAEQYKKIRSAPLPDSLIQVVNAVKGLSPDSQVTTFMQHLHDYYHYMGDWRASTRGYIPFSLKEIASHKYGDCKDLSTLLVALLNAVGIEADPVFVYRGIAPPFLLPNAHIVNHAIVRAKIGEETWWLDPTNPVFLPGHIPFDIADRWALLIENSGKVSLIAIPSSSVSHSESITSSRILPDSSAIIRFKETMGGQFAIYLSALNIKMDQSMTKNAICSTVSNTFSDCQLTLEPTQFVVPKSYKLKGVVHGQKVVLPGGSKKFLLNPNALSVWRAFEKYLNEEGQGDIYLGPPSIYKTIHIFENITLEDKPKDCSVTSPWFDLKLEWVPNKKAKLGVIYKTRVEQKVSWLNHQEMTSPEFKTFFNEACACTKEKIKAFTLNTDDETSNFSNTNAPHAS